MNERTLFLNALQKEDLLERKAFLEETCGVDAILRQRIEVLLRSHECEGSFLDQPAIEQLATASFMQTDTPPEYDEPPSLAFLAASDKPDSVGRLGHYEVQEVIGQGGMGIVLKAFDGKLHRVVAIKVMASALATSTAARRRFAREAQAAAAIGHDHAVTIHGVEEADGLPYLVMQYVAGMSLQQRLEARGPLQLAEILRIGMQTASGLAAAHAQGLIHRDVKPANILLENGVERVKITDFGLARAVDDASLTQSGVVAGTPNYMAPEQARGESVDPRSDLFSLGSVIYAMCTGRAPFRTSGAMAVLKRVCEETPGPIRETNSEIPDWLVAIIEQLHAKNPAERFQSAAEVADLLGRCLAHVQHPSVAPLPAIHSLTAGRSRPPRYRCHSAVAAAIALVCLLGSLSLTEATGVTQFASTVIRIFMPNGTLVVEVDDPGVKVTIEGDGGLVITGAGPQEVRLKAGSYLVEATKDGKPVQRDVVAIARGSKRVVKVIMENNAEAAPPTGEIRAFLGHEGIVWNVAYSSDGRHALSKGSDQTVRLWDIANGQELRRFETPRDYVCGVPFSSDGRFAICGYPEGGMMQWEVETGKKVRRFGADAYPVYCLAYSPDDQYALTGSEGGLITLWDIATGKALRHFRGHRDNVYSVAFSPDGSQALSGGGGEYRNGVYQPPHADHSVRLWDVKTGAEISRFEHTFFVSGVAFSPDGRYGLSGSFDGTMRLWDLREQKESREFQHDVGVASVAYSPDGRFVLSGDDGHTILLWDVDKGIRLHRFDGHTHKVQSLAFSPDGRMFLSGSWDGTVRLWQMPETASQVARPPEPSSIVLLGELGLAEVECDTLADAVSNSSDGDTIEIRGDTPFVMQPITLHQSLTIRASTGFWPVIPIQPRAPGNDYLTAARAPLVLEGLDAHEMSKMRAQPSLVGRSMIHSDAKSLHLANCRLQ